jgi:WD40 repeat protein
MESLYEHSGPVTCLEKNFKNHNIFASGGKDSKVFIWDLNGEEGVEFIAEIGKQQLYKPGGSSLNIGEITSLKWFDENVLALSLTNGTI